jgi:hypothetical protein
MDEYSREPMTDGQGCLLAILVGLPWEWIAAIVLTFMFGASGHH